MAEAARNKINHSARVHMCVRTHTCVCMCVYRVLPMPVQCLGKDSFSFCKRVLTNFGSSEAH